MSLWISYIAGAVIALAYKIGQHFYNKKGSIWGFFFNSTQNSITTVTTFGVAWFMGAMYLGLAGDWGFPELPQHPSLAFVLGSLAEVIAPKVVNQIQERITFSRIGGKT